MSSTPTITNFPQYTKMAATQQFINSLQYERSVVADEYFERCAPLVFEKDYSKARLEARCLSAQDLSSYGKQELPGYNADSTSQEHPPQQEIRDSTNVGSEFAPVSLHLEDVRRPLRLQSIDINLEYLIPFLQVSIFERYYHGLTVIR